MSERKYNTDYAYVIPPPDAARTRCYCMRCRGRGLMGPAVLVTLGLLFMLSEFGVAGFHRTWPILLIVIGVVRILAGNLDTTGHVENVAAPPAPGTPPAGPGTPAAQNPETRQVNNV